jgi:hypothetical protein
MRLGWPGYEKNKVPGRLCSDPLILAQSACEQYSKILRCGSETAVGSPSESLKTQSCVGS